jgi:hypothetical protein
METRHADDCVAGCSRFPSILALVWAQHGPGPFWEIPSQSVTWGPPGGLLMAISHGISILRICVQSLQPNWGLSACTRNRS